MSDTFPTSLDDLTDDHGAAALLDQPVTVATDGFDGAAIRELFPRIDWHELWADERGEEWIIEPLVAARRLTALYSPPKLGKSLLLLEISVAISRGSTALGDTPDRPYRVLYIDFENDPRGDIRERLQDMGYGPDDLDALDYLTFPSMAALDTPQGGEELLALVKDYGSEVVVIDTVSRAVAGDENSNDTWLDFYRYTGLALKKAGVSLFRLDHCGKDESKGQRGGSAKSGDVDSVWRLSEVVKDKTYKLDCEANRMPIAEKEITIHRETVPVLRHRVDARGWAGAEDAKVEQMVKALDAAGLPNDAGRKACVEALKLAGVGARTTSVGKAIKLRKARFRAVPEPREQLGLTPVPAAPGTAGNRGFFDPSENAPDQAEPLFPNPGNSSGTGVTSATVPIPIPRDGNSSGTRQMQPVVEQAEDSAPPVPDEPAAPDPDYIEAACGHRMHRHRGTYGYTGCPECQPDRPEADDLSPTRGRTSPADGPQTDPHDTATGTPGLDGLVDERPDHPGADPEMALEDRAADVRAPSTAVGNLAGDDWPTRPVARESEPEEADGNRSTTVRLLADIKDVFSDRMVTFLNSQELCAALGKLDDAPWRDELTSTTKLARMLRQCGITPKPNSAGTARGYRLVHFEDAFARYVRQPPSEVAQARFAPRESSVDPDPLDDLTGQNETAGPDGRLAGLTPSDDPPAAQAPLCPGGCGVEIPRYRVNLGFPDCKPCADRKAARRAPMASLGRG